MDPTPPPSVRASGPPTAAVRAGVLVAFSLFAGVLALAFAQPRAEESTATLALVPDGNAFVRDGALLYDHHCSVCHGDTGGGLEEARLSFPESDRTCTRCHKTTNPPRMDHLAMDWRNAFDVGIAPPLVGEGASLDRYANGAGLFGYLRATMPRPFPGSLGDEEYAKITAFLAAANGSEVEGAPTDPVALGEIPLR